MPKLAPVFASTTLVMGVASFYLWQQLHAERAATSQLRDRVAQLERGQARPALAGSMSVARPDPTGGQQPAAEHAAPVEAAGAAHASAARTNASLVLSSSELLKDPDYREGATASLRANMGLNHPGLAKELDLTPEQVDKLYDLLTKNQMAQMADALPTGADEATMRDAAIARQEVERKREAEVVSLLGDTKYQQWKDYQQSLPARRQVEQLRSTLEGNGTPLAEPQQKQLIAALAAEDKQRLDEARQEAKSTIPAAPRDQVAMLEESVRSTEQNNNRTVDLAAPYLNSQQLDTFRKMKNQSLAVARALARAQRALIEEQRSSGSSAATSGNMVVVPAF